MFKVNKKAPIECNLVKNSFPEVFHIQFSAFNIKWTKWS